MNFKVDDIISISIFDKETGQPIQWIEGNPAVSEADMTLSGDTTFYGKPQIGDHIHLSANAKKYGRECRMEIDGFYGGPANE